MQFLLDVQDHKVAFVMELLQNFPFLKAQPIGDNYIPNSLKNNGLDIMQYVKPMRDFTIDDLVREQNYQGFDANKFKELAAIINIKDEPLEELLSCIK